jgi:YidC/Oxa1 family membrane protein insertase
MEQRLLLVFALTFVVILLFQPLLKKYLSGPPAQAEKPQPAQMAESPANVAPVQSRPATPSASSKQASVETETVVENDLYRITFTNRGAQVKSWILKKYDDEAGQPLDLVNGAAAAKYGYPLSLWTYDDALRNKLNSALYVPSKSGEVSVLKAENG